MKKYEVPINEKAAQFAADNLSIGLVEVMDILNLYFSAIPDLKLKLLLRKIEDSKYKKPTHQRGIGFNEGLDASLVSIKSFFLENK